MSDDDPDADDRRLTDIEERLKKARAQRGGEVRRIEAPNSKLGVAFRLVTELLAAVIVGGGLGWGLDRIFATGPLFLIVMFLVGVAAGFFNVVRTAQQMNKDQAAKDADRLGRK